MDPPFNLTQLLTNSCGLTQNTKKKVQVIVDTEEDLGKLRIYFDGSSLEKVPLSSKRTVHLVFWHSAVQFLYSLNVN